MPSDRRQLNVRMDDVTAERFDRLMTTVSENVGVTLSQAQLVALAFAALEEKHGGPAAPAVAEPAKPKGGKGKAVK